MILLLLKEILVIQNSQSRKIVIQMCFSLNTSGIQQSKELFVVTNPQKAYLTRRLHSPVFSARYKQHLCPNDLHDLR